MLIFNEGNILIRIESNLATTKQ